MPKIISKSNEEWKELYDIAKSINTYTQISPYVTIGFVSTAIKSKIGKIYKGVCVDNCCGLGLCAERNALTTMLAEGDFQVDKIVTVGEDGKVCQPCGACREFMAQMSPSKDIQIAVDSNEENITVATLKELTPNWWV